MIWMLVGLVFLVTMAAFVRHARREIRRGPEPAPLESSHAREAIRAAIERRQ